MGKVGIAIAFVLVVAVLAAGFFWVANGGNHGGTITPQGSPTDTSGTTPPTLVLGAPSSTAPAGYQNIADGATTILYPTADFSVATSTPQMTVHSYIPPCDPDFDYCVYYIGTAYHGTNFDSAGIRILNRTDLTTETACLTTPPTGYTNFTPTSTTGSDYSVSEFAPLGDAGAGHFAKDVLYRVEYNGACYEFETRIGQSQFANYPAGSIQEFTIADQTNLQAEMQMILANTTLPGGETITFPN